MLARWLQELEIVAPPVADAIGPLPALAPASQGLFDVLGSVAQLADALANEGVGDLPAGLPTLPGSGRRLQQVEPLACAGCLAEL